MDGLGRALSGRYAVRGVPTLIVLNANGKATLRQVGRIQQESVLEAVADLLSRAARR